MSVWQGIGSGVFVRRYPFLDSNVGAIVGDDGVLVVDTRTSHRQAGEILAELRQITPLPVVRVVNTHVHADHVFGNARFERAEIWGHERCASGMRTSGEEARAQYFRDFPDLGDELREVVITPPDHTFADRAIVAWGGRTVELRYLGRGHTDSDIVVVVPGQRPSAAPVVFAGDLLENDAPPWFGDAYPLDWPATAAALVALGARTIVPGHGSVGDRAFASNQAALIAEVAAMARRVTAGDLALVEAITSGPFPPATMREALGRALAQLRGELD